VKIFITGGSGYLGEAVVRRLVANHDVHALARSPESTAKLAALGAKPVAGDLAKPDGWKTAATEADCIVNMAADSDYRATDKLAVMTILDAARASKKARRVIYTSGCLVLGEQKEPAGEDATPDGNAPGVGWRALHEQIVLKAAGAPLSTAVVRPGWVFGGQRGWFNDLYFGSAEREGASTYYGSGENRWPMVHVDDVASLYEMLIARWHEGIFHAADASAKTNLIAAAASLAAGKQGQTRSIPVAEAQKTLGPLAEALIMDNPMAAPRSREVYGWKPRHAPFIESAQQMFKEWKGA